MKKAYSKLVLASAPLVFALSSLGQTSLSVQEGVTRSWIGPGYWTNPLMNWRLSNGRIWITSFFYVQRLTWDQAVTFVHFWWDLSDHPVGVLESYEPKL